MSGIRPFLDRYLKLETQEDITGKVISALPAPGVMEDAVVRLWYWNTSGLRSPER